MAAISLVDIIRIDLHGGSFREKTPKKARLFYESIIHKSFYNLGETQLKYKQSKTTRKRKARDNKKSKHVVHDL